VLLHVIAYIKVDTHALITCFTVDSGDGTEEDFEAERLRDKQAYEEKKRAKAEKEAEMRKFAYKYKNKKPGQHMVEAVEVVDSDED
jgi:hypothetical protein